MKKCSMWAVAALSAMMVMFTSCLNGGTNEVSGWTSGVMTRNMNAGGLMMLNTGGAMLYVPELDNEDTYPANTCLGVNFMIDYSSDANAAASQQNYLVASLLQTPEVIEQWRATFATDTVNLMDNEILLTSAYAASNYQNYVNGWLMFASNVRIGSRQIAEWKVYYPQNPTVTATSQGINCYDFYIRATIEGDETGATVSSVLNAYYLKSILDRINSMERNEGNEMFNIRFKFAKDTAENKITEWNISNPITIPVTQQ